MGDIQKKYEEYIEHKSKSEWLQNDSDYDDDYWLEVKRDLIEDIEFEDEEEYIKALDNVYSQPIKPILRAPLGPTGVTKAKAAADILAQIKAKRVSR